jgi:hypothetical protein
LVLLGGAAKNMLAVLAMRLSVVVDEEAGGRRVREPVAG